MNFYKKNFVCLFVVFSIFSFLEGCKPDKVVIEETPPISERTIEKFSIAQTEDGKLKMMLEAESADIDENENSANLELPEVKFYDKGKYSSTLVAERAIINLKTYDVKGIGKCVIDTANNERLETTDLMYNAKRSWLYSDNDVKVKRPGQTIYGKGFNADTKLQKITIKKQRMVIN
ncbi:MAG: LPS export ABC transporter periplasmic protein LptC [Endomicrobium sp.]|jgi:LPS export ABC transporter protein LptC|nr:LPS export ABC transporter periplasmic protein LptC [Endomicrobium sp.]